MCSLNLASDSEAVACWIWECKPNSVLQCHLYHVSVMVLSIASCDWIYEHQSYELLSRSLDYQLVEEAEVHMNSKPSHPSL